MQYFIHKRNSLFIVSLLALIIFGYFSINRNTNNTVATNPPNYSSNILSGAFDARKAKTDAEWKKILTSEQYHILREAGTEVPFTGALNHETRKGTYYSVGCDKPVFRSEQKYDSGTGWPSFWAPINKDALVLRRETVAGDDRIEVLDVCGGHLGHVFDDGPKPTGKRYCMNSIALYFEPDKKNL